MATTKTTAKRKTTAKKKPRSLEARVKANYRKAIKELQMWSTIAFWALVAGYLIGHEAINAYLISVGCQP